MKKLLFLVSILALSFASCKKCKNEDPRARVVNSGSEQVDVHIETTGNTVNINNVQPGTSTEFVSYAAGYVLFRITVGSGGSAVEYESNVLMEECFEYDIALDASNNIVSTPTDRNE